MKISTKGRYALRLMLDLAMHNNGEYIPLKVIGDRQNISVKYLEQIINVLVRAGYVKGVRGSKGGYKLSGNPEDYTAGMILRLIEGRLAPVACLDDSENTCPRKDECLTLPLWHRLQDAINDVVDSVTLAELIRDNKKNQKK